MLRYSDILEIFAVGSSANRCVLKFDSGVVWVLVRFR